MEYIKGTPLCQVDEVEDPKKLYHTLMNMIVDLAQVGLIHSDFNEFNLVLTDEDEPVLIDFPQMVSTSHQNADIDVQCIVRFFGKRFQYEDEFVPKFEDIVRKGKLDVDVEASGFMKKLQKEFKQFDAEIDDNFDEESDSENHSEDGEDSLSQNDEKSDSEEKNEALVEDLVEKLNFEDENEQHKEDEESKITPRLSYEEVKKIVAKRIVQQSAKQVTNLARKAKHAKGVKKTALSPKDYNIIRNAQVAKLYEDAILYEPGTAITSTGALVTSSGAKKGRSPTDKRPVNIKIDENVFMINRERAVDYLNTKPRLYVFDGYAGWDPKYRIKVRIICARAYHEELKSFGTPDFTIINAGEFPCNRYTMGMTIILGTQYAGEMKKGIFTVMHYLMPKAGVLSLHSSANEGIKDKDVSLFFGLSGTGKTTLSADPHRSLIGDDEHCWSHDGIFNIEGGCYAKCIDLSRDKEPEIFDAIKFGSVLENVVYDPQTRLVSYTDSSLTENTRCAYPIEFIPGAKVPCMGGHPKNLILLTCDAFGVLPPVSKLTTAQAMYHFISGYTAKVAGTEEGVKEPAPFLVWHPVKYATMLAEKMKEHSADAWGELAKAEFETYPIFNLQIPKKVTGVPDHVLNPAKTWLGSKAEYDSTLVKLAKLFQTNFMNYSDKASSEIRAAGPVVENK
ncbi:hypothetical protein ROZALSC1DRAFT_30767 [Rozella allomycis CSF55]|uniref:Phosphoenolpyruvate carboxykinase (ATP) n=1 Tax=Rozella allomycis (strain CSF55) TaxID=988480 RepID=A0A4P9YGH2_ROZAC|nr:hypothetical protein ROZALSC1DRAFT_30767 [Rozella allomycis CSF55]